MGVVVLARHLEIDQPVAIKFLVGDAPPNALERFMREAKAAALVKSEHVCRVYDFGRLESGEPYIVMEYLEGTDLCDKITSDGPQPVQAAVGWIVEACDALSSAHAQGIVHRDLKPANLFLQESHDGTGATTLKVVDFGISKLPTQGALTSTAVMMGSPFYMSPEQLESSRDVDGRSDIWSLGIVLYELLTGSPPFNADSLVQLAVQAREREPERPTKLRPDLPPALEAVILKCLAKRPEDRYSNVNAIVVDLAPFAPPEVGALVSKLARRASDSKRRESSGKIGDSPPQSPRAHTVEGREAIGLSKTTPSDAAIPLAARKDGQQNTPDPSSGPAPYSAPRGAELAGGRTFAPVQTKSDAHPDAKKRTRSLRIAFAAVIALGAIGVAGIAASTSHRRGAAQQTETTSSSVGHGLIVSASDSTPVPSVPSSAPVTLLTPLTSSSASATASSSATPNVISTGKIRPIHTSRPPASTVATEPSSAPPAPTPTTSGRKKRELDRDYQTDPK